MLGVIFGVLVITCVVLAGRVEYPYGRLHMKSWPKGRTQFARRHQLKSQDYALDKYKHTSTSLLAAASSVKVAAKLSNKWWMGLLCYEYKGSCAVAASRSIPIVVGSRPRNSPGTDVSTSIFETYSAKRCVLACSRHVTPVHLVLVLPWTSY